MEPECKTLKQPCPERCTSVKPDKCRAKSGQAVGYVPKDKRPTKPVAAAAAAAAKPRAASMTAAHKAQILDARPKLPFGSKGSLCVGMGKSDCDKAKVACHWISESKDGKRKAHCGRLGETDYKSMNTLRPLNTFNYHEDEDDEKADQPIVNPRRSAAANVEPARAPRMTMTDLCAGMVETDCKKPSVQMACKWTNPSKNGKKEGYCGKRTDSNLESAPTAKEMAKKFAELDKKSVVYAQNGGKLQLGRYFYYGEIENGQANGYGELYDSDNKTLVHKGHFKKNQIQK
jgi:hypothetical protein